MYHKFLNHTESAELYDSYITAYGIDATIVKFTGEVRDDYGDITTYGTETTTESQIIFQPIEPLLEIDGLTQYEEEPLPVYAVVKTGDDIQEKDRIRLTFPVNVDNEETKEFDVIQVESMSYYFKKVRLAPIRVS